MAQRFAAVTALTVFAVCLISGGIRADNPFMTTVGRALAAMGGTFVVGLLLGWMAQKMLDEEREKMQAKTEKDSAGPGVPDR